jgi:hypothetical protein
MRLNQKRLTRKQVQELIALEGRLHQEFTHILEETYMTGYKNQPQVYELSNDRLLFVFDPKEISIGGKGDIYTKAYFSASIRRRQKVKEDHANGRIHTTDHWTYYSKYKEQLVNKIDELVDELGKCLDISRNILDFSYKSLDILSSKCEDYGIEKIQVELYDCLVAYVGEVIRRRLKGDWIIRESYQGHQYPLIDINDGISPILVVWQCFHEIEPMNLRKACTREIRRAASSYC